MPLTELFIRWTAPRRGLVRALIVSLLMLPAGASAKSALDKSSLSLEAGGAEQLKSAAVEIRGARWESSAPDVVEVYQSGWVVALKPGEARVKVQEKGVTEPLECIVTVVPAHQVLVDPATLKQYPDSRDFRIGTRKCYGSELNGQRAISLVEKRFTRANRVVNPNPLHADKPLEWELQPVTEVYDGAGVLLGTVRPRRKNGDRLVPTSMFNFGTSKVLNGRICVYGFSLSIKPAPGLPVSADAAAENPEAVETSAWLPLDKVLAKEVLVERIGLGTPKLPSLPLEDKAFHVTGGDPKLYATPNGEMSIVKKLDGPVPSHYLLRPSGTINLIFSVPGFGLGGEGTDSLLVRDGLDFYPAKGAKVFVQPTYFPKNHPQAGKVSPQTMTFIYGAIKAKGVEPVYGWIAKEALDADKTVSPAF